MFTAKSLTLQQHFVETRLLCRLYLPQNSLFPVVWTSGLAPALRPSLIVNPFSRLTRYTN